MFSFFFLPSHILIFFLSFLLYYYKQIMFIFIFVVNIRGKKLFANSKIVLYLFLKFCVKKKSSLEQYNNNNIYNNSPEKIEIKG